MNALLNYMMEANIGLLIFLVLYKVLLRHETNFRLLRIYLLSGIGLSLILPLFHFDSGGDGTVLSVSQAIPSYWLPEVVIGGQPDSTTHTSFSVWKYITVIYSVGFGLFALAIAFQLMRLFHLIAGAKTYRLDQLHIAESTADKPIFSFFNFIFIGKADALSPDEKQQIILHERVHAAQGHSFDILLINILKVVFWFNPLLNSYKKIFIQLHEFEADARAVSNSDVNRYCSLLAKVALKSAGFSLANHFNNSLTIKRIEMMRTQKSSMKRWKLAALGLTLPFVFFFIACQDQVADEVRSIAETSAVVLDTPPEVKQKLDELKKANPEKKFLLLEPTEEGQAKLDELIAQKLDRSLISGINVVKLGPTATRKIDNGRAFVIVEYSERLHQLSETTQTEGKPFTTFDDKVFTVVQQQPEFKGGYDAMVEFFQKNLQYPQSAREAGIEGRVFVSFIVEKDGTITDTKVIRGLDAACDAEAVRTVQAFPNWVPGKQNGQPVRTKFVLPINFKL